MCLCEMAGALYVLSEDVTIDCDASGYAAECSVPAITFLVLFTAGLPCVVLLVLLRFNTSSTEARASWNRSSATPVRER